MTMKRSTLTANRLGHRIRFRRGRLKASTFGRRRRRHVLRLQRETDFEGWKLGSDVQLHA